MNPHPSDSLEMDRDVALPASSVAARRSVERPAAHAESTQKTGKSMILAGFVITILGVVLYCATCFAGGADADLGDVLFRNAVPFARATLAVLGVGTLVWLVGSFTYLRGAMDADDDATDEPGTDKAD